MVYPLDLMMNNQLSHQKLDWGVGITLFLDNPMDNLVSLQLHCQWTNKTDDHKLFVFAKLRINHQEFGAQTKSQLHTKQLVHLVTIFI